MSAEGNIVDHEFSHRLDAAAHRIWELVQQPPVQLEREEAVLLVQLLHRAATELFTVELLRKEVASLKRTLRGKSE